MNFERWFEKSWEKIELIAPQISFPCDFSILIDVDSCDPKNGYTGEDAVRRMRRGYLLNLALITKGYKI